MTDKELKERKIIAQKKAQKTYSRWQKEKEKMLDELYPKNYEYIPKKKACKTNTVHEKSDSYNEDNFDDVNTNGATDEVDLYNERTKNQVKNSQSWLSSECEWIREGEKISSQVDAEYQLCSKIDINAPRNFIISKNELGKLVKKNKTCVEIDKVNTSGRIFKFLSHMVTGEELNKITSQIQNLFIEINSTNGEFIKEFESIYSLIDSLDKEYIPGIVGAVKTAEEASNQAQRANNDIQKMIDSHKKAILVLQNHKAKLDRLEHLNSIDEIWERLGKYEEEISELREQVKKSCKKTIKVTKDLSDNKKQVQNTDIDEIKLKMKEYENRIVELEEIVSKQSKSQSLGNKKTTKKTKENL